MKSTKDLSAIVHESVTEYLGVRNEQEWIDVSDLIVDKIEESLPQAVPLTVLFSRRENDFLHVYQMVSPPRIGETVALLESPFHSCSITYKVVDVQWTPDHTRFDVTVVLERFDP